MATVSFPFLPSDAELAGLFDLSEPRAQELADLVQAHFDACLDLSSRALDTRRLLIGMKVPDGLTPEEGAFITTCLGVALGIAVGLSEVDDITY